MTYRITFSEIDRRVILICDRLLLAPDLSATRQAPHRPLLLGAMSTSALDVFIDAECRSVTFSQENVQALYERVVSVLHKGLSEQRDFFDVLGSLATLLDPGTQGSGEVSC